MSVFDLTQITGYPDQSSSWPQSHDHLDICAVRFSPESRSLAIGCFNGDVYIRFSENGRIMYRIRATRVESPISSITWHPHQQNVIICSSANGHIMSYHVETGQLLWELEEKGNCINSLKLSQTGAHFATVGSDCTVRLYNTVTKQLENELASKSYIQGQVTGHSNRIFASAFIDISTLASSGWDDSILIWDIRSGNVVRTISGPHICGDAMDVIDRHIITGSYRNKKQLEIYDIGTGNCIRSISIGIKNDPLLVNALKYQEKTKTIMVGGSGINCCAFYNENLIQLGLTPKYEAGINAVDLSDTKVAYGLSNSYVYVQNYSKNQQN